MATATEAQAAAPAAQVDETAQNIKKTLTVALLFVPVAAFVSLIFVPWFRENITP